MKKKRLALVTSLIFCRWEDELVWLLIIGWMQRVLIASPHSE